MEKEEVNRKRSFFALNLAWNIICTVLSVTSICLCVYYEREIAELKIDNGLLKQEQLNTQQLLQQFLLSSKVPDGSASPSSKPSELMRMKRDVENYTDEHTDVQHKLSLVDLSLLRGPPGKDGRDGKDGKDGSNGKDGNDGRDGRDGKDGKDCNTEAASIEPLLHLLNVSKQLYGHTDNDQEQHNIVSSLMRAIEQNAKTLTDIQAELAAVKSKSPNVPVAERSEGQRTATVSSNHTGTSYIRWGRTTCANTSQLLYEGFVGGQYTGHTGGASDRVCLPLDPDYDVYYTSSSYNNNNYINGAEYQVENGNYQFYSKRHHNIPCARCYTPHRSTTVMIPAKRSCPTGWTKEYEGYLMSEKYDAKHSASYSCVDKDPQSIFGLDGGQSTAYFYFVQASCSTTGHCPPYIDNAELTCVVCTK